MRSAVPSYFDPLIAGFHSGQCGRNVHLGYWDEPPSLAVPCKPDEFEAAQARLTDVLIDLAAPCGGQSVLDIGCGFGGTLAALGKWPNMHLAGVNIDWRQLDICRSVPIGGSTLALVMADACALPFRAKSFDTALCIEAMFHFRDRAAFLRDAARILRRGGRLVLSDILLRDPGPRAPLPSSRLAATVRSEYGPWPEFWIDADHILELARQSGLKPDRVLDATRQTLPSYRFTAPQNDERLPSQPSAGSMLRWLHREGYLTYLCACFTKA